MTDLAKHILPIIRSTRDISFPFWGNAEAHTQKDETAGSVVTKIDLQIEEYLAKEFLAVDGSISFVGEEFGGDRTAERFWLVDPIDGTAHYILGLPFCTTMVALIENGQVVFSAIYDFVNDRMYYAEKGKGAFCNDARISVREHTSSTAYISFESRLSTNEARISRERLLKQSTLITILSSGWELAMVASGKLDGKACIDPYGKDYDFAPGSLLVSEAGGMVRNIGTETYDYRNLNFIMSNKSVYENLTTGPEATFPLK